MKYFLIIKILPRFLHWIAINVTDFDDFRARARSLKCVTKPILPCRAGAITRVSVLLFARACGCVRSTLRCVAATQEGVAKSSVVQETRQKKGPTSRWSRQFETAKLVGFSSQTWTTWDCRNIDCLHAREVTLAKNILLVQWLNFRKSNTIEIG